MRTILIKALFLLTVNSLFGSDIGEASLRMVPIIEVDGEMMPGWETQIIKFYHDEEGKSVPVVFRGAAKNWDAARWTPEWFADKFGDEEIVVISQDLVENGRNSIRIDTTIKDHINDILFNSINSGYLLASLQYNATKSDFDSSDLVEGSLKKNSIFIYNQLDLMRQTGFPQIEIRPRSERIYTLFIGSKNSIAPLHSHGAVFLAQMYGRKRVILVHFKHAWKFSCEFSEDNSVEMCVHFDGRDESVSDYNRMCCCPIDQSERYASDCVIDITNPDFENYPEVRDIEAQEVTLEAGDVLYIPDGWLHDVRGMSTSISIASGF